MDFGYYGNKGIKTPNIDKLAIQGICFQYAFNTSPQSSPSRTSMMTGCFAHTIGAEDLFAPLDDKTLMIPSYLKSAGYASGSILKRHWGANGDKQFTTLLKGGYKPLEAGLESSVYENYNHFLDENINKPFFLWVGFVDPHRPYNNANTPQVNEISKVSIPPYLLNDKDTRNDLLDYYNEISRMDKDIGIMIAELEKRKLLDNTIIVFLSDNGLPFPRAKASLYDSGIQTPQIMYGKSIANLLFDNTLRGRDYIYSERNWHDSDDYIRRVRTEKYKYIYNAYYNLPHGTSLDLTTSPSWYSLKKMQRKGKLSIKQSQIFNYPRPMIEIYDIVNDPFELNNIADTKKGVEATRLLPGLIKEWQKQTHDHPYWEQKKPDAVDRISGAPYFMISDEYYND